MTTLRELADEYNVSRDCVRRIMHMSGAYDIVQISGGKIIFEGESEQIMRRALSRIYKDGDPVRYALH